MQFEGEIARVSGAVHAAGLRPFGYPHLVVDDIFSDGLVSEINANWPDYKEGFIPEVPGNHILHVHQLNLLRMKRLRRRFWRSFNARVWPAVIAAASEALAGPLAAAFGVDYVRSLALHSPLTLMQADASYAGHGMHTHFYHCPHWAFTILLYIDPEDRYSQGTGVHRLLAQDGGGANISSYQVADVDWRAEVALDTFHWLDPKKPERRYEDDAVAYRANRLFVFLDGPLALHSVPFDNADGRPNPARSFAGGRYARRRILRSHVKVGEQHFFARLSPDRAAPIEFPRYLRIMAPSATLEADDRRYRDEVLRPFFCERLYTYAKAAAALNNCAASHPAAPTSAAFYTPRRLTLEALKRDVLGR